MLKLYKFTDGKKEYWETWENEGVHTIHWGELGTRGTSEEVKPSLLSKPEKKIQKIIDSKVKEGFQPFDEDDWAVLLIEYEIEDMGTPEDLEKRHNLEDRMNETLGWTGLGNCDGGSIGSGTMEVCCLVVDFEVALRVISEDLKDTEFANYKRIYDEGA